MNALTPEFVMLVVANIAALVYASNKITSGVTARFVTLEVKVEQIMTTLGLDKRMSDGARAKGLVD